MKGKKMKEKKELGLFKMKWTIFKTRRNSLTLKFVHIGDLYGARGGKMGIGIKKVKRNIFLRIGFWIERLRFKTLTIKDLRKLPTNEQIEYLHEKYYLYGITPYFLDKVERTPPRADDPLNQKLPPSEDNNS